MRRALVAANWKMHHVTQDALRFAEELQPSVDRWSDVDVAIFPPAPLLTTLGRALSGSRARLGGQCCHQEREGAFTGEVSAAMLADAGCSLVLCGHSERRHVFGETDEVVAAKVAAALEAGIDPILCVGETEEEREASRTDEVLGRQLDSALADLGPDQCARLLLAYEPVWAIGTGRTATPEMAQEAHAFLRGRVAARFGADVAAGLVLLYGGSVKPGRFQALLDQEDIDGGLVGGASLEVESFAKLMEEASALRPRAV